MDILKIPEVKDESEICIKYISRLNEENDDFNLM
jgi:hypothetical protein